VPIDPSRYQKLNAILDELYDLAPERQAARLDDLCEGDPELRRLAEEALRTQPPSDGTSRSSMTRLRDQWHRLVTGLGPSPGAPDTDPTRLDTGRFVPGTMIAGRYRIVALVARGGMGEVYRADDLRLGHAVALKFLRPELEHNASFLVRLTREVSVARQISHPNVCRVYDLVESDVGVFMTMEYVDGEDLASLLRRIGRLTPERAIDVARQLAAGLAAAHEMGLVHRDFKPGNVMMDGRGRIRVTDFGLTSAAGAVAPHERAAGTPAYMSPEQAEAREVTVRSDVYALGLVLFEIFVGKRPPASAELPRALEHVDPAVARVIERCLAPRPEDRPSSALAVLRELPGGDPLTAALARGETPSPDVVAAAGPKGAISARTARALLAGFVVPMAVVVALSGATVAINRIPPPKPKLLLEAATRDVASKLGYDTSGRESYTFLGRYSVRWQREHLRGPRRWNFLEHPNALSFAAVSRFSTRPIAISYRGPWVSDSWWGDVTSSTDTQGRLRFFEFFPWPSAPDTMTTGVPDWGALFALAGLDSSHFTRVPPERQPELLADTRAAWLGTWPDGSGIPSRLEAAALRGRIVFFEILTPDDPYWDPRASRKLLSEFMTRLPFSGVLWLVFFGLIALGGGWALMRNIMSRRGDRRGALRLAMAVLVLQLGWFLFGAHHPISLRGEFWSVLDAAKTALLSAVIVWAAYLVLEPELRRTRPDTMVAWSRVLDGRWRDPLVGRDFLIGMAVAPLFLLFADQLHILVPPLLGLPKPPPPMPSPGPGFLGPITDAWLEGSAAVAGIFAVLLNVAFMATAFFVFFFVVQRLVRWRAAATGIVLVFMTLAIWTTPVSDYSWIGVGCGAVASILLVFLLDRLGIVATSGAFLVVATYHQYAVTLDPSRPYFSSGMTAMVALLGIALLAARVATGAALRRASASA